MQTTIAGHDEFNQFSRLSISESPMALVLTEEQSMLRDSARGLISDKAPVSHLRKLRAAPGRAVRGAGGVREEFGRAVMPPPFLSTGVRAGSPLSRGGSEAQKSQHL